MTLAGVLLLAGCMGGEPIPTLPPTPSTTPVFASEEEALAAAEAAYAAYLEMSNLISSEGGVEPERIAPFVTEERLQVELRGFETLRGLGYRILGPASFEVLGTQRVEQSIDEIEVVFYVCWDGSLSRVVDASGVDVTPSDRVDRTTLEVVLRADDGDSTLRLAGDEEWPDASC